MSAPTRPRAPERPVTFTPVAADDDGTIAGYAWDLDGDGGFDDATGVTAEATFLVPGPAVVRLRVADDDGASVTTALELIVGNRAPTATYTYTPNPVIRGEPVPPSAQAPPIPRGASTACGGTSAGTARSRPKGATVTTTFPATRGPFRVDLVVTDRDGGSTVASSVITPGNLSPSATVSVSEATPFSGQAVLFTSSAFDRDGVVPYAWDLDGDGAFDDATGPTASATFAAAGRNVVRLRVTDDDDASVTVEQEVIVRHRVPAYMTLYLQQILGLSAIEAGLVYVPGTMLNFCVAGSMASVGQKVSARTLIATGLVPLGAGQALLTLVAVDSSWWLFLPGLLVAMAGTGILNPIVSQVALSSAPPEQSGLAAGVNDMFRQAGIAVGVAALGALVPAAAALGGGSPQSYVDGFHDALWVGAVLAVAAAAATALLIRAGETGAGRRRRTRVGLSASVMVLGVEVSLQRHALGLTWVERSGGARAASALVDDGRVWLIDPYDHAEAIAAAAELGTPAGVLQLLDRHNRDCAAIAERLGVPLLRLPADGAETPFTPVPVVSNRAWREVALWWAGERALVVAEAIGTVPAFALGRQAGVHPMLRLTPPRKRSRRSGPSACSWGTARRSCPAPTPRSARRSPSRAATCRGWCCRSRSCWRRLEAPRHHGLRMTTSPAVVRARTSTDSADGSGASAASSSLWTRPAAARTSSQAGVPSGMPTSRSPSLVSSTTELRTASPSRTSPLADLATTLARDASMAMLPLAALTRRSPPARPTQVSPLELRIAALEPSSRTRTSPDPAVSSAWPVARST